MKKEDALLDTLAAAIYLNVSVSSLNNRRYRQSGPIYLKVGGSVRYRRKDLDDFREAQTKEVIHLPRGVKS